jgi:uncharacterized protein YjdB
MRNNLLMLLVLGLLSCSGPTEPTPITSITVTAPTTTLASGAPLQLTASLLGENGKILTKREVTWSSSNTTIAAVTQTGLVTAGYVLGGVSELVTLTATSERASGSISLTVNPSTIAQIEISPASASIAVGAVQPFTVSMRDARGNTLSNRQVNWSTADAAVASVLPTGTVTLATASTYAGPQIRTVSVIATSGEKTATATLAVTPIPVSSVEVIPSTGTISVGTSQQLSVSTKSANGAVLTGRTVSWISSDTSKAVVSSEGLLTAKSPGIISISAQSEGKTGSASFTIPIPVARVAIIPATPTVGLGSTLQLNAETTDASGNVLTGRAVEWSSSDQSKATISNTGVVTPIVVGTALISATSEGKTATATLTVLPVPVSRVTVNPNSAMVEIGATRQLTAIAQDAELRTLTGRTIAWTSSDSKIATVSASGLVTGVSVGNTTIVATSEGKSGTATIIVTDSVATELQSGNEVTIPNGLTGFQIFYRITVGENATELRITMSGGTGDLDMWVQRDARPTTSTGGWICRGFVAGNNETCVIANPQPDHPLFPKPGVYYILIDYYESGGNATLRATIK